MIKSNSKEQSLLFSVILFCDMHDIVLSTLSKFRMLQYIGLKKQLCSVSAWTFDILSCKLQLIDIVDVHLI